MRRATLKWLSRSQERRMRARSPGDSGALFFGSKFMLYTKIIPRKSGPATAAEAHAVPADRVSLK